MTLLPFVVVAILAGSVTALRLPDLNPNIAVEADLSEASPLLRSLFWQVMLGRYGISYILA